MVDVVRVVRSRRGARHLGFCNLWAVSGSYTQRAASAERMEKKPPPRQSKSSLNSHNSFFLQALFAALRVRPRRAVVCLVATAYHEGGTLEPHVLLPGAYSGGNKCDTTIMREEP